MENLKWSRGNSKLIKLHTVSFGIPALMSADGFKTCPQAGACAAVCYARQGMYIMPNVKSTREFNLKIARENIHEFIRMADQDLSGMSETLIRIHDSGDFFSQTYLDAWIFLARKHPEKKFYAYTKSLHLNFTGLPSNFKVTQSEGGKLDSQIDKSKSHSRIFTSDADRRKAGYGDGSNTDTLAIRGAIKIGLVYHGTRKLTDAQSAYFK